MTREWTFKAIVYIYDSAALLNDSAALLNDSESLLNDSAVDYSPSTWYGSTCRFNNLFNMENRIKNCWDFLYHLEQFGYFCIVYNMLTNTDVWTAWESKAVFFYEMAMFVYLLLNSFPWLRTVRDILCLDIYRISKHFVSYLYH